MSQQDTDETETDLPAQARGRAFNLRNHVPKSQARTAAMRDLGYSNAEIADALGVTDDAASSYYSKFNTNVSNAPAFILSTFGGPKSVRGWQIIHDTDDRTEYWYAVKPIHTPEDLEDARAYPPEGDFALVKVRGTPTSFDADTTHYESLDAMADDIYRNAQFDDLDTAQEVRGVLTETGMPEDKLEDPRSKVN